MKRWIDRKYFFLICQGNRQAIVEKDEEDGGQNGSSFPDRQSLIWPLMLLESASKKNYIFLSGYVGSKKVQNSKATL